MKIIEQKVARLQKTGIKQRYDPATGQMIDIQDATPEARPAIVGDWTIVGKNGKPTPNDHGGETDVSRSKSASLPAKKVVFLC